MRSVSSEGSKEGVSEGAVLGQDVPGRGRAVSLGVDYENGGLAALGQDVPGRGRAVPLGVDYENGGLAALGQDVPGRGQAVSLGVDYENGGLAALGQDVPGRAVSLRGPEEMGGMGNNGMMPGRDYWNTFETMPRRDYWNNYGNWDV